MPGGVLTYIVVVENRGPVGAINAAMTDPVPAGTTFVSAAQTAGPAFTLATPAVGGTGNVRATIPLFASGASATFRLDFRVIP